MLPLQLIYCFFLEPKTSHFGGHLVVAEHRIEALNANK